ncbi:MAG: hypothetical protein N4A46_03810, partial [Schleiferiaceae bacterium]|nr:hypothetical protein [Schleiferiaceae bacterium]
MRVKLWILSLLVGGSLSAQDWVQGMQDHSVNFYTVQQQFNNYWKDREQGKGKGYKQFKRWEWFMEQRVAPDGDRPDPAILYNTLQESYKTNSTQDMGTWTAMGPFDAPQDGFNGIGRINGLEFHPTQPDTMWAGSPSGGLWITYDNGQNWFTPTDDLPNIGVSDIAVDPQRPHILYMATGDRDGGDTYSYGVLKSTDGGLTWGTTGFSWNVSQQRRIGRLIVHPNDTNVVVVASRNGIYRSTDEGATFSLVQAGGFNTIIASPAAPDTMFAGTISNSSARVYRSIDGGANWTLLNSHGLPSSGGTRRVELAISHQDPDYVYALYSDANQEFYGLYQTTNGGDNWSLKSSSPNILGSAASGNGSGGQSWYDLCLSVSTVNKNQVFVGGINLWRSNNAGQNWTYIGGYSFPRVHPDMHYMKFKPGTNTMYVGHDGGITYTSTAGASWVHLVDGFNITQYYKMSTSQQSPDVVIGGSQDNSTHVLKNGVWDTPFGGDGMDCEINPLTDQYMYGSSQYGNFRRSSNGGASFNYIGGGLPNGSGGWVTPIELDPVTPSTVYIGYSRLWKSTNNGISWTATGTQSFGQIDEIAIAPSNTSVIYISINSSIYRSVNGGQNWSNITSGIATQRNITDIAISSTNENHIWVTKSGYDNGVKVFESIDGGQNWSNVSGTLPNLPANTIEYAPGTSDGIYVGTDVGVYYKDNNLSDWISFSQGLPNVIVIDLEIYHAGKKLRTATYGRGIWESDLYSELVGAPEVAFIANPSTICSLNDTITLNDLSTNFPTSFNWTITPSTFQFVNGTSATSQNPQVVFTANANYTVTLTASNVFGSDTKTEVNAIGVGGYQLPFLEDFEGDYAFEKWSVNNPDGDKTWTLKTANAGSPGGGVAKMRFYNVSGIGNQDELISPAINLATVSSATMTFDYAYKYYNSSRIDTLEVYISTDCGATWTLLSSYNDDGTGNFATGAGNGSQTTDFMPAMASDWCGTTPTCKSISLDSYVGSTGALIKFVGINGNGNNLYLDNINITGVSNVQPTSDFISDTVACMNNTIQFMDISQNYPTSWEWTFTGGRPATSSIQFPNVSYSVAGTYPV